MPIEDIVLPRPLVNQLLHYAQSSPDAEVCGMIGGTGNQPSTCYPISNSATETDCRYTLDPDETAQILASLNAKGETLFGIFHSHPRQPAVPTTEDLATANYPDALYLIVSLGTKGVLELRGFRVSSNREVNEVNLLLEHG
jgi:proteasome lid subunit RPN8/RPN11